MNSSKCAECGLANFAAATACRRCGTVLTLPKEIGRNRGGVAVGEATIAEETPKAKRGLKKKLLRSALRVFGLAGFILFLGYTSLITTSEPIVLDQKQAVERAIGVLDNRGFEKEAFVLRYLTSYRATDNWWNKKVGHERAYAATNFPFEVVTLYPSFFKQSVDDVERAAILLHEAYHLLGYGEEGAFEGAWRDKKKLGWTKDKYGNTAVWANVSASTRQYAPQLFECGPDRQSDCTE